MCFINLHYYYYTEVGILYIIYVSAVTGGGQGPSISVMNFTQQGSMSPYNNNNNNNSSCQIYL